MASEFNAVAYARELESAGVTHEQAAVHASTLAKALDECVPAREFAALRMEVKTQFDAFRIEVNARFNAIEATIAAMDKSLRAEITSVRAEVRIVASEIKMQRWLLGISVALQIGVILKLIYPSW